MRNHEENGGRNDSEAMNSGIQRHPAPSVNMARTLERFPVGVLLLNKEGAVTFVNPAAHSILGCSPHRLADRALFDLVREVVHEEDVSPVLELAKTLVAGEQTKEIVFRLRPKPTAKEEEGATSLRWVAAVASNQLDNPDLEAVLVGLRDISEHMQAHTRLKHSERFLHAVVQAAQDAIVAIDNEGKIIFWSPAAERLFGYTEGEMVGKEALALFAPPDSYERYRQAFRKVARTGKAGIVGRTVQLVARKRSGVTFPAELSLVSFRAEEGEPPQALAIIRDISARKRAEAESIHQAQLLESLRQSAERLASTSGTREIAERVVEACVEVMGADLAWVGLAQPDGSVEVLAQCPADHAYLSSVEVRWDESPLGKGPTGTAIRTRQTQVVANAKQDERVRLWRSSMAKHHMRSVAAIPLVSGGRRVFGSLNLYSKKTGFFSPEVLHVTEAFANLAAAALESAHALKKSEEGLSRLQALRNIDMAITSSLDSRVTLRVLLEEVIGQLAVDAADVLVLRSETQSLEFLAGRGFRSKEIELTRLRLGEGYSGRSALERKVVVVPDLEKSADSSRRELLEREGFVSFACAPLVSRGKVLGVLEAFCRTRLSLDNHWAEFLEAVASQAAIAIESAQLFSELERSHVELVVAYDATIEGWSRAMDYRDKATEGHTLRVTELTVQLARRLGVTEEEIVHVRRGALLHDMGKLGVPDYILQKPGPLTAEEWELMRHHPQIAYDMLAPIAYLRPALDIPLCHHERWDGSGYPRGLKGEEIPLAARIFAVADVWDALTNDRPYRPAWSKEEARAYLREQAGRQFDPKVVEALFELERGESQDLSSDWP